MKRYFWIGFKCGAKTITVLFWICLYFVIVKMTFFKNNNIEEGSKDKSYRSNYNSKVIFHIPRPEKYVTEGGNFTKTEDEILAELESRRTRVLEVCRRKGLSTKHLNSREFFVVHKHNLVWCNIFKAASSSWLYNLNILGGYDRKNLSITKKYPLEIARKIFPRPSEDELRDALNTPSTLSLIVVREPFVRLLSAYRDKLEKSSWNYKKLALSIKKKYPDNKLITKVNNTLPSFTQFISYLIDHKNDTGSFNEHWAPYYKFCTPCAANFSVIAKVETLKRDTKFVVDNLGLNEVLNREILNRKTMLRNVINKSKDGKDTTKLVKKYFSKLNKDMLDQLLDIYGLDFELFGYDSSVYYKYVKK